MRKQIFLALLFSSQVFAADLKVEVQQFNFKYSAPHGEGEALVFSHNLKGATSTRVTVEKIEDAFKISLSGSTQDELEFKNAPAFIKDAESMEIENFNLLLSDRATLSVATATFEDKKDAMGLSGFSLDCNREVKEDLGNMDQLILGCITKMVTKGAKVTKGSMTVKSLDFKSVAGKYNLSAEVKAAISGKVKSSGELSYDATKGILTVKINEVKLGILGITGQVFKELKKSESEKLKVNNPYVYITVK
jgi:hypothetical protein